MKRGYGLYLCDECKETSFHHWIEKNRSARMRCPTCGCSRLELVTEEAKKEAIANQRIRVYGHPDMTDPITKKKIT